MLTFIEYLLCAGHWSCIPKLFFHRSVFEVHLVTTKGHQNLVKSSNLPSKQWQSWYFNIGFVLLLCRKYIFMQALDLDESRKLRKCGLRYLITTVQRLYFNSLADCFNNQNKGFHQNQPPCWSLNTREFISTTQDSDSNKWGLISLISAD